jgi:hypothetical protein
MSEQNENDALRAIERVATGAGELRSDV